MRIAILSLYSGHIDRGVETWTREMASRLRKRKNDVLVLQGSDEKIKTDYEVQVVDIQIIWKYRGGEDNFSQIISWFYWFSLNFSFTLRSIPILVKFKPDIILPTNGGIQTLLIKIASLIFGWKIVITGHAGIGAPEKWNLLMRPDIYVSPSIRGKNWTKNLWFSKGLRIENIPHGVDLEKFSPGKKDFKLPLERPIILCVSSLDPFKRVDLVVRAVSKLEKGSLLILGGDRDQGMVTALAEKLLGRERFMLMKVSPAEIPKFYRNSDLFTLPSNEFEAFGIVYLEALASGLPVVATDDALRKEIIRDAGILVNPEDIDVYAKALEKALKTDWGDKPRNQAKKFSWDKVVKKYESLFQELTNKV
ncbi:hypothetical protein A2715_05080 [Candidatus Woesebacteria bacterium RIFCSPHIGHO2_01_FULL_39_32]|uniref:Glycosyl transferase family 1 domain-containing protein n=1 Tax=Candidatus Woesebacteria bacterium RIFCSPLOWO2_01_FULL_39_25 TaxID=1802521 RepID=A0A1F8BLK5_9BACT|nr:MAG: hypothetical protein A2124_05080 [Candidatus Woesebacteria bacterium GWB1_37_5]OGM25392.1 MAG: hypothetical protein A2715_05080 [Candidatus Woesebacteria bacterium RIFCSPHIGHO2_01_FULL_39_32]OGM38498.1 MAG: hypothetical protein A3F01_04040 [Candidatus Woesebacteria bacterium RIFCSPHIGHO2_12_FULL_38_11]OGM64923.1 MAG: hypothetical protein A2893_04690 [Candidatus Woesebacteria bacterium RIFCSPLOWO2_01_FULL_39_25]